MRVVMLSKALVVGAYQKKAEEIARLPGVELTVLVPPFWAEGGRRQHLERAYLSGYQLRVVPMALNGHFHVHFYPSLGRLLCDLRPDIVHVDEEPYNLATVLALRAARRLGARTLFFTWQNLLRRLPLPFRLLESHSFRLTDWALAGNAEAVTVLRKKGFRGPIAIFPQFGIDPDLYQPAGTTESRPFTVGYLGRLVEEKGLCLLLGAVKRLTGDWRLEIIGAGPLRESLARQVLENGLGERVTIESAIPSIAVPAKLASFDVLVLPSLTRPNWKEQFGRVLVEAMACGVAVVGSDSGEIPNVVGDAGLVFPEGDVSALNACFERLRDRPQERRRLALLGRERALSLFTQERIAEQTYAVYRELFSSERLT